MSGKRIVLALLALALVWFAFFRRAAAPKAAPKVNAKDAANNAVSLSIGTAARAAQPYIADLTGRLFNGIAHSVGSGGGVNSADTPVNQSDVFTFIGPPEAVDVSDTLTDGYGY